MAAVHGQMCLEVLVAPFLERRVELECKQQIVACDRLTCKQFIAIPSMTLACLGSTLMPNLIENLTLRFKRALATPHESLYWWTHWNLSPHEAIFSDTKCSWRACKTAHDICSATY
eukprot:765994-Amphidinium_carterae.1